ncbi:MAG: hypothetical protein AAB628_02400 [Patescibacteria group bacterium]
MANADPFQRQVISDIVDLATKQQHGSTNLSYNNFKHLLGKVLKKYPQDQARFAYLCGTSFYNKVLGKLCKKKVVMDINGSSEHTAEFLGIPEEHLLQGARHHEMELCSGLFDD